MLGHREHTIQSVVKTDNQAVFAVTIITKVDQQFSFQWALSKVTSGKEAGSWMTVGVSLPLQAGDAI